MTSELLDSLTRRTDKVIEWFQKVGVLVVDEAHLLTMKKRGSALECALMRFSKMSDAKIIFLSATMSNTRELAGWLSSLNGKSTYLIETDWRPCKLDIWYEPYSDAGEYFDKIDSLIGNVINRLESYPDDKFIVFVHSKSIGKRLLSTLIGAGVNANFHNADLSSDQRKDVTANLRAQVAARVLVATSTLAYGLNLPARRVIIAGVQRGMEDIPAMDLLQVSGRAGRVGLDPKGDVYIFYPESQKYVYVGMLQDPSRLIIESRLSDKSELAFHIVSEINEETNTFDKIWEWYERSFAVKRGADRPICAASLITYATHGKSLKKQGGKYILSGIGKIAAWFYYSPYMVALLKSNFQRLSPNASSLSIAWAIGTAMPEHPVSADLRDEIKDLFLDKKIPKNQEACCYAAYLLLNGQKDIKPELTSLVRGLQVDSERLGTVLKSLKGFYRLGFDADAVGYRLRYGISDNLVPLVKIKGIGPAKAKRLYDAGFKSAEDIANNATEAARIIGNKQILEDVLANSTVTV